jgi:hypothetical protein
VYAVGFPAYFGNAFTRYTRPLGGHGHLRGPTLVVLPGDVTIKPGDPLTVRASVHGALPEKAVLEKGEDSFAMRFDGRDFVFPIPAVGDEGFTYRVVTAQTASPRYRVIVVPPPGLVGLRLRYDYPPYAGLPVRFEEQASGDVEGLLGTQVTVTATADTPLAGAFLERDGTKKEMALDPTGLRAEAAFEIAGPGSYTIAITGRTHGLEGGMGRRGRIRVVPDRPPQVSFVKPRSGDRYRREAPLRVVVRATDDFGVARLVVVMAAAEKGPWRSVKAWPGETGKQLLQEPLLLYPKQEACFLRAVATDHLGQETVTEPLRLTAFTAEEVRETDLSQLTAAAQSLRRILELQKALLDRTVAAERGQAPRTARAMLDLSAAQEAIVGAGRELLRLWDRTGRTGGDRLRLALLVRRDMEEVIRQFRAGATSADPIPHLARSAERQRKIIRVLTAMLASLGELAERVKAAGPEHALGLTERVARRKEALEALHRELLRFVEEQRDIISSTEKLVGKRVDDFTMEEAETTTDLAEQEEAWAGVIQAQAAEYAKLAAQDLADSTLVDELIEAYSEVDAAASALKVRSVEIAVPFEQSGLELAEELTVNIERWLADRPDWIKWSMEDPVADVEVPLVDLPQELEDIVGELIDQEQAMTEDIEDVTSGWLDSVDEGAGWDVMDGPIGNMSAKGITGNLLPNQQEIGGRSGEGRSGKSHGQIVEKEASGKGGRPTPTRVTPDAFEAGQVKDTSTDPTSGATGGGKFAGTAPEGLRGPVSPDMAERLRGLAAKQTRIRSEAERMERRLRALRITADDMARTIALMRAMEDALRTVRRGNLAHLHHRVVRSLRSLEADFAQRAGSGIEGGELIPGAVREGMANAGPEAIPEAYEALVREYFEKLARGSQ